MAVVNPQTIKSRIKALPDDKKEAWHKLEEHPQKGEGCIYLRVFRLKDGFKKANFVLRYKIKGSAKKYPLGVFLSSGKGQSWSDVREKAEACRVFLRQGIDPNEHLKVHAEESVSENEAIPATLQTLVDLYLKELERKKAKDIESPTSTLKLHVTKAQPELAKKPAHEITPEDISHIIETMIKKGITTRSNRALSYLTTAFNLVIDARFTPTTKTLFAKHFEGVDFSLISSNPAEKVKANPEFEKAGTRALSPAELTQFITGVYPATGLSFADDNGLFRLHAVTFQAIRFLFAVGGDRMVQVLSTPWSQIDLKERFFELKDFKGRRSQARLHSVYLNDVAMDVLAKMKELAPPNKFEYPFPSVGHNQSFNMLHKNKHFRVSSINQAIKRFCMEYNMTLWKGCDIRRTCTTLMIGKCKIRETDVAIIQGHSLPNVSATQKRNYNRYAYWEEKKTALTRWSEFLKEQGF